MKIKMLVFRQGYFYPEPLLEGVEYDLKEQTAKYLIELGVAVSVQEEVDQPEPKRHKAAK